MGELLIIKYRGLESAVFYSQVQPGFTHGFFEIFPITYFPAYVNAIKYAVKNLLDSGTNIYRIDSMKTKSPNVNHLTNLIAQFDGLLE